MGHSYRAKARLDFPIFLPDDPTLDSVLAAVRGRAANRLLLGGCEPTLRRDLPAVLAAVAASGDFTLGLWTDGLALQSPTIVAGIRSLGISFVRIPFHSGRSDAHDWVAGLAGASRRVAKAVRLCAEAGLEVEVETVMTRPTISLLGETVTVAQRLGASAIHLRMPRRRGDWQDKFVSICPRYGMLDRYLSDVRSTQLRPVTVRGLPRCVLPNQLQYIPLTTVQWLIPGVGERIDYEPAEQCRYCDASQQCDGPARDYTQRFGWTEIRSRENQYEGVVAERIPVEAGAVKPPPRAGRAPATRLSFSVNQSSRPTLGGDPLLGVKPKVVPQSLRVSFGAPARVQDPVLGDHSMNDAVESTRAIRRRLVRVAQQGTQCLRIASAGSLAHPAAGELLRECRRLSMDEVEVCGEASGLSTLTDREIRRMRGITRFYLALYGPTAEEHDSRVVPGAFEQSLAVGERLATLIRADVHFFAIVTSENELLSWDEAWRSGTIPGVPHVRLAPVGGSMSKLTHVLKSCSESLQRALMPSIPYRLRFSDREVEPAASAGLAFGDYDKLRRQPSACDIMGTFTACADSCQCVRPDLCPGLAIGWLFE